MRKDADITSSSWHFLWKSAEWELWIPADVDKKSVGERYDVSILSSVLHSEFDHRQMRNLEPIEFETLDI